MDWRCRNALAFSASPFNADNGSIKNHRATSIMVLPFSAEISKAVPVQMPGHRATMLENIYP
jgi:hypothetical protein